MRLIRCRTPLLFAATNDKLAVARLLVYLGANPDAVVDRRASARWLVYGGTSS